MNSHSALALAALVFGACRADESAAPQPVAEGGAALRVADDGPTAFSLPLPDLTEQALNKFFLGNAFFNLNWVSAPGSASNTDGLGPLFNARSCSSCHFRDGRGQPPAPGEVVRSMVLRLSIPGEGPHGEPLGDPSYGDQLQDKALPSLAAEAKPALQFVMHHGQFGDGTPYELREPIWTLREPAYGALAPGLRISARVAPHMVGLGLLEAISVTDITAREDADDRDHDGISGRANRVWNVADQTSAIGRFGWKAEQPNVRQQVAGALLNDMGLTSRLFPTLTMGRGQEAFAVLPKGGEPEVEDTLLEALSHYAGALAVPQRRPQTIHHTRGEAAFVRAGCDRCHVPTLGTAHRGATTNAVTVDAYTDLLLHDMGEGLSDGRPSFQASGREWRTPPLWGLGLVPAVNGHGTLLHDGRARSFAEAVLWHGGEAGPSRAAFLAMKAEERADMSAFLEAL